MNREDQGAGFISSLNYPLLFGEMGIMSMHMLIYVPVGILGFNVVCYITCGITCQCYTIKINSLPQRSQILLWLARQHKDT